MSSAASLSLSGSTALTPSSSVGVYKAATDAQLVAATLAGNLLAFDELIRRYRAAVFLVAHQCTGDRAVAEEVAQDTFLLAFQALPRLSAPGAFGGWLRAIARNRATRVASREWRSSATEDSTLERISDSDPNSTGDTDPLRTWEKRWENETLWQAFDRLPDDYREVLYLHHCEEWPLSRIAGFYSVPETTIKGKLWRARQALKKLLTENTREI